MPRPKAAKRTWHRLPPGIGRIIGARRGAGRGKVGGNRLPTCALTTSALTLRRFAARESYAQTNLENVMSDTTMKDFENARSNSVIRFRVRKESTHPRFLDCVIWNSGSDDKDASDEDKALKKAGGKAYGAIMTVDLDKVLGYRACRLAPGTTNMPEIACDWIKGKLGDAGAKKQKDGKPAPLMVKRQSVDRWVTFFNSKSNKLTPDREIELSAEDDLLVQAIVAYEEKKPEEKRLTVDRVRELVNAASSADRLRLRTDKKKGWYDIYQKLYAESMKDAKDTRNNEAAQALDAL